MNVRPNYNEEEGTTPKPNVELQCVNRGVCVWGDEPKSSVHPSVWGSPVNVTTKRWEPANHTTHTVVWDHVHRQREQGLVATVGTEKNPLYPPHHHEGVQENGVCGGRECGGHPVVQRTGNGENRGMCGVCVWWG